MNLTFLELPAFTEVLTTLVNDNDYRLFQNQLSEAPEPGLSCLEPAACARPEYVSRDVEKAVGREFFTCSFRGIRR